MSDDIEAVVDALQALLLDTVALRGPVDTTPIRADLRVVVLRVYASRTPASQMTTTEKGLGWEHQKQREYLLARHVEGALCWWCGLPMFRSQGLAADHSHVRAKGGTKADRLLHGPCNSSRGDGSRDHTRPALTAAGAGSNRMVW